ncbi:MAG: class I SAM-dependent methyltransferase [Rubrivivax sp.]|nr:class I SAM-dependent methyltransferase [Rubrivivax sp.]
MAAATAPLIDADSGRAELHRWLRRLARVFDLEAVIAGPAGGAAGASDEGEAAREEVVRYYEQCHAAYRRYHSAEGALHMALNPHGRFDAEGFAGQLRRLEARWDEQPRRGGRPVVDVLELAFGQGYNLAWLLPRHPGKRFQGIDLTAAHVTLAHERLAAFAPPRLQLAQGDFHHLPQTGTSIDAAFSIESMCHATDLPQALREAARVLRPGGELTLFDGYLPRPLAALQREEAMAVQLVARGLAVARMQTLEALLAGAREAGLVLAATHSLDAEIMPSLARLQRVTRAFVRWPWFARRALAKRPPARSRNVLAGCLMHTTFGMGLLGYREIVLRKEGVAPGSSCGAMRGVMPAGVAR